MNALLVAAVAFLAYALGHFHGTIMTSHYKGDSGAGLAGAAITAMIGLLLVVAYCLTNTLSK